MDTAKGERMTSGTLLAVVIMAAVMVFSMLANMWLMNTLDRLDETNAALEMENEDLTRKLNDAWRMLK
jgi:cell division protein FtsL